MSRWPFSFSLDDVVITGAVVEGGEVVAFDSDRIPGVTVTHEPTGTTVTMTMLSTRDQNVEAAFRRLDRHLQRAAKR